LVDVPFQGVAKTARLLTQQEPMKF